MCKKAQLISQIHKHNKKFSQENQLETFFFPFAFILSVPIIS